MVVTAQHIIGALITVALFVFMGVYSGKKVKTAEDFAVSGKSAGSVMVAGTIMGTMIGGASTIGTSQMAFVRGVSAWWFTLGGGLSCLLFCIFFTRPFRKNNNVTFPHIIQQAYGEKAALAATIFITLGMAVNIIPQIISVAALISSFSALSVSAAAIAAVLLMAAYVCFGGVRGAGILGIIKTVLTSFSLIAGGMVALWLFGGPRGMLSSLPEFPWFSFLVKETSDGVSSFSSLIIGVLTGQIYLQAIVSAKSLKSARKGTLISAVLGPLIGLGGVLVGLFMRSQHPEIMAVQALPLFVIWYLPEWLAGVILATLLFAAIGTGAGLALGICTILNRDLYQKLRPQADDHKVLGMFRILLAVLLGLALTAVLAGGGNAMILEWSYVSLGFRGVAIFLPMVTALFLRGRITQRAGRWAGIFGPLVVIIWRIFKPWPVDPLYSGLLVSCAILFAGYCKKKLAAIDAAGTH